MRRIFAAGCAAVLALSPVAAAQQTVQKKVQKKDPQKTQKRVVRKARPRVEKLACRVGPEDRHARIAVELRNGKVHRFAYYSKWKPRTCSMEVQRDDAYSSWEDTGNVTVVTLVDDTGAFLIDHERSRYKFIFRDIDRMRYCGMEGKVSGSLTIFRGRSQCVLEGVMERGEDAMQDEDTDKPSPQPSASPTEAPPDSPVPESPASADESSQ